MLGEALGTALGGARAAANSFALTADKGAFAIGGQAATLLHDRLLAAAKGAFVVDGKAAGLLRARIFIADKGAFVVFGYPAGPHILGAAKGAFAVDGKAAGLLHARVLVGEKGAFVVDFKDAGLAYVQPASTGHFVVSGKAAAFTLGDTKLDLITSLRVRESRFMIDFGQQYAGIIAAGGRDLRPGLWRARLVTIDMTHDDAAAIEAQLRALDGIVTSFQCWNPKMQYPQADLDGSTLGSSTVTTLAVSGAQFLSLQGLPADYVLTRGDFLHFDVGTVRMMHRIVDTVTADGSGDTSLFRVAPDLHPSVVADLAVTLIQPAAEMFLIPQSFQTRQVNTVLDQVEFEAMQVR